MDIPVGWIHGLLSPTQFGPRITVATGALLNITGLLFMAYADSKSLDFFIPAYVRSVPGITACTMTDTEVVSQMYQSFWSSMYVLHLTERKQFSGYTPLVGGIPLR